jgi:hypothetical protein
MVDVAGPSHAAESARPAADVAWLLETLWGETSGGWEAGRAAASQAESEWAIVPSSARPELLLPLASRSASIAALTAYNRLRTGSSRAARRALAIGIAIGAGPLVTRTRVRASAAAPRLPLEPLLLSIFGRRDLEVALKVPRAAPNRKPVLQVFSRDGMPLGYVKVGWNEFTRSAVRNEAEALSRIAHVRPATYSAPRLLHAGSLGELEVVCTAPLPLRARRPTSRRSLDPALLLELSTLSGGGESELCASPFWARLEEDLTAFGPRLHAEVSAAIDQALAGIVRDHGERTMRFGSWHGDWSPWNLAWAAGRLRAIDWEQWSSAVPVGFDSLHYRFSTAFGARRRPLREAIRAMDASASTELESIGVPQASVPAIRAMYLLTLFCRAEAQRRSGAGVNPRVHGPLSAYLIDEFGELSRRASPS